MLIALANTTLDTILYQDSGFWVAIEGQRIADILDKHLQEHARKWAKTFPDEFWVAYSGAIRPPVPMASGHPFRFDPAGDSGVSGHPQIHLV